jgi:hypothetical protein
MFWTATAARWTREADTGSDVSDARDADALDVEPDVQGDAGDAAGGEGNQDVYERLYPTCVGCHPAQASLPSFSTLQNFEALIVYNENFVIPGDAEASELVALLEGRGTGQYDKMPIGEQSFLDLERLGLTDITVAEVREWINALQGGPGAFEDGSSFVQRLSARQIQRTLYQQLGLQDGDWFNVDGEAIGGHPRDKFPMRDPIAIPGSHPNSGFVAEGRWAALGGSDYHVARLSNRELAPTFALTLIGVAQSWCRLSFDKPGNDALFRHAIRTDTSESNPDAIQRNIAYLWLRMLGAVSTDEDVREIYEEVFLVYEERSGVRTAWVAVCSTLIRDPLWGTY